MKDKNLKYIAHAIIVVAFMGLIAFVIYYTCLLYTSDAADEL